MEQRMRLGRVAGIGVAIHWSVLLIALLLGWSLAAFTLPAEAPGYGDGWYWGVGLVAVVLFFGALLAHELAHSIVARRHGVEVEDITLWLFGGVSRLRGEPRTPGDELRISIAGPATSFALAVVFALLAAAVAALTTSGLVVAALLWLAFINGLLGLFNLAPAAPLDGGRVLHAIVWRRSGDHAHATQVATRAGQRFAYFLIGLGVVLLLLGDLAAVWFVFLGWFLLSAARAEATQELLHDALAHLRARDVMTPDPIVVPETIPLDELVDGWFLRSHCSAYPTVDAHGDVQGLVTLRRVRTVEPQRRASLRAADVADPLERVVTCHVEDALPDILERMAGATGGDGRALVVDGARAVGIISPTDVQRALDVAALRSPRPAHAVGSTVAP